jgi:hypothetical protein
MFSFLQLIMGEFAGFAYATTNKIIKFVILQVLPYRISGVTDTACCFSHLHAVAAVCRLTPCDRLPSITWCFLFLVVQISIKDII